MRPALDLLARVGDAPPGDVVDLGCGAGAAAPALRARFPGRPLLGVDVSPAMLARAAPLYDGLAEADIAGWRPERAPAVIFSNAALNWVPDHAALLPRLLRLLAPGGRLAVQVPDQHDAPSHRLIHAVAAGLFPGRFYAGGPPVHVLPMQAYARLLRGAEVWRTTYLQRLPPGDGHPVRRFTESTAARPVLDRLDGAERAHFLDAYDGALAEAYPFEPDGTVLMPFARLFLAASSARPGP